MRDMKRHILTTAILLAAVLRTECSHAAGFTLTTNTTNSAQTVSAGGTGTVNSGIILNNTSGSTIPVTMSTGTAGSPTTLINNGIIEVTGTGSARAVQSASTNGVLVIQNNLGATIFTINNDTVAAGTGSTTVSSVALTNAGTIESAAGGQAVNFNKILSGTNSVTNSGLIKATGSDAIRPGVNGTVSNSGTIQSIVVSGSSSDGVDVQTNTGVVITNASNWSAGSPLTSGTGLIDGGRHGITGGLTLTNTAFTTSITNNLGGTIRGLNGSGVNLDGLSGLQTATIVNGGTITGTGVTGDGDGVDVDGLVNITNTGTIRSVNAFSATVVANSEGITVGGGTIVNSGTIEGLVTAGNTNAVGKGISLLGNDITTGPLAGTREAIYGNAVITNQNGGLIRGDSDSGIVVGGPASGFTVTINNNAGATIRGGATLAGLGGTNAAILTGADNDTINTAGTIDGSSNGRAIAMGGGNNTLNITGGTITGSIDGGTGGTNALTINPGAGNAFSYGGAITNFNTTAVQGGRFNLSGSINSTSAITISSGGIFNYTGAGALGNSITVNGGEFKNNGGNFTGALTLTSGTVSGTNLSGVALSIGAGVTLSPGNSPGTMATGSQTWAGGGTYLWEINRLAAAGGAQGNDPGWDFADITGTLTITANAGNKFHINLDSLGLLSSWDGGHYYSFNLATASGGIFGFDASDFLIDTSAFADQHYIGDGFFSVSQHGNTLELDFTPVPEPATIGIGIALMGVAFIRRRRGA